MIIDILTDFESSGFDIVKKYNNNWCEKLNNLKLFSLSYQASKNTLVWEYKLSTDNDTEIFIFVSYNKENWKINLYMKNEDDKVYQSNQYSSPYVSYQYLINEMKFILTILLKNYI